MTKLEKINTTSPAEIITKSLRPKRLQADKDVRADLRAVVGIRNKIRFLLGKEPRYTDETLSKTISDNMTRVTLADRSGGNRASVPIYSWQTVYKTLRTAGLSPRMAQKETSRYILILD